MDKGRERGLADHDISLMQDENVLKLNCGDGCTNLVNVLEPLNRTLEIGALYSM